MRRHTGGSLKTAVASFACLMSLLLAGCGGGGEGGNSQVVQAPPPAPTAVKVVISAANELTVSWSGSTDAASYNIYWSTVPGASTISTKISSINSTSYIHQGLTPGTTYYYVVTAVNSYGESAASLETFALLDTPRPAGAVAAVAGNGEVTVSWSTNGAVSYNIYMASQSGVTQGNYATLPDGMVHASATGSYRYTGLVNGKTYYFVVTSVNSFGESIESSEVSATPAVSSPLTVTGTVRYEDKQYGVVNGNAGFTGATSYKAVRFAEVQAVDALSGVVLVSGTTDANGLYSLTLPSSATIYIRVISVATSPISAITPLVHVKDTSNTLYAVAGPDIVVSGAVMNNILIQSINLAVGAFNILDVYTSGAQFVQSLSGSYPPAVTAFWKGGNPYGTYFCTVVDPSCIFGEGIYVLNYSGDTDEFDDDVLWHEYGHFIAAKYSKDDSPGGVHYLGSNDLDLRLSWSEGWGDFFPGAVKTWLNATPALLSTGPGMAASQYVDTSGASGFFFDFGNPVGLSYVNSSNEAAVAKVLIDVRNAHTMQAVWDTFSSNFIKTTTAPVNMEVFWDGWNSLGKPDISAILGGRSIRYLADSYEALPDNTANVSRKASLNTGEPHTLFGSADIDYVAFDVTSGTSYTAKTTKLTNGADTVIRIIAPGSVVIASNDNTNGMNYVNGVPNNCDMWGECHENGFDILGSSASFTATASGTYYVEVKSSPNRPLSAGKYGDYLLTVTSP